MPELDMKQMMEIQSIKLLKDLDDLNGLLEIVVFLHKFDRGNISNFIKDLRLNQQPVYRTLDKLSKLGLVTMKREPLPGRKNFKAKYYYLTDKGKKLAKSFVDMFNTYRELK